MKKTLHFKFFLLLCLLNVHFAHGQIGKCKGKYFGNIIANTLHKNYTENWNQITMENASKWQSVEGTRGRYNFTVSDIGFNWAKENGGLFKYHTLMWGAQTPGWVSTATSATIQAAIEPYFKAVADHYKPMGGLKFIDVLNEPINTKVADNLKAALTAGYQAEPANAGDRNNQYGWAIWCFQLARKHFPDATLLINEYNIEMNWNNCRAPYIAMSNAIKNAPNLTDGKKNLIDGIGLQAHGINNLTAANFKSCIDEIWNKTGLPLHITEFDATAEPNEAKQRDDYARLIPIAWEHPHVAGITLWGYIQGATWIGGNKQTGPGGTDSGIMYSNGLDRPAMAWLRTYMASKPSLACCPAPASFASCDGSNAPVVNITAPLNNASFIQGSDIELTATATDADGTIANVKFYDGTTLLTTDNTSPYSFTLKDAAIGTHVIKAEATDNSGKISDISITIRVNVPQSPFNNVAHLIPGIVQAEEFDKGGNGFAYNDLTPGSETGVEFRDDEDVDIELCTDEDEGFNIGWSTSGEWLEYTVNVQASGLYDIRFRVAEAADGKTFHLEMDGVDITGDIDVPNTGGWQEWANVSKSSINLEKGEHVMRVVFDSDYINLNYIEFTPGSVTHIEDRAATGIASFPNHFSQEGLKIAREGKFDYKIYDLIGSELEKGSADNITTAGTNLLPGVYILSILQEGKLFSYKVVRH